jgi:type IV pilus assembly protein PilZ
MAKLPSLAKDRRAPRNQAPLGASHEADTPSLPGTPSQPAGQPERRSGADRRQHERVLVDWAVDYRASDTFLFAYISDISAMGIFVRTPNPEPAGTRLNLRFSPPGGQLVELEAQVIWINPPRDDDEQGRQPGMGLQFVDLSPAQREQVLRLVRTFAYLPDEEGEEAASDGDGAEDGAEREGATLASAERARGRKPALC